MEAYEDSNCLSLSDSFSLYERYMRSFNVTEQGALQNNIREPNQADSSSSSVSAFDIINGNVDNAAEKATHHSLEQNPSHHSDNTHDKIAKHYFDSHHSSTTTMTEESSSLEHSIVHRDGSFIEQPGHIELPVEEDSKSSSSKYINPVLITSLITMENSNNAVFHNVRPTETVFKLPITELSFNGTIEHVQKLQPIVDPITALSSSDKNIINGHSEPQLSYCDPHVHENIRQSTDESVAVITNDNVTLQESTQSSKNSSTVTEDRSDTRDQSMSSLEGSFDSGVRSPDIFSDEEYEQEVKPVNNYLEIGKEFEAEEKVKVKKIEAVLQHVFPPPPSVRNVHTDVTEMLKKYYCFLPAFNHEENNVPTESAPSTPSKNVSFIKIPEESRSLDLLQETAGGGKFYQNQDSKSVNDCSKKSLLSDKLAAPLKYCTESEVKNAVWPDMLKCRYHDLHYNITNYSEKLELLSLRYIERFVGLETASSVTVYSKAVPSPSSACKRKALRLKMSQNKSPGRRLSHLARRRQVLCSAATFNEKLQTGTSKMVLIDKNFFPHRKLTHTSERKSPRQKRVPGRKTPGKKTPGKKTPGKKTPIKTPRTQTGSSSKKKAMRRLLLDSDSLSRTLPTRETSKRALFISPENRKPKEPPSTFVPQTIPNIASVPQTIPNIASVPQALKCKRALFNSPSKGESKSLDGTASDNLLKRKRSMDPLEESRSKIPKSLSFGGDMFSSMQPSQSISRRASECTHRPAENELNDVHKKKLLWAVSEALRSHGLRMGSTGFREKASTLYRLMRRLLSLPAHRARLSQPRHSTSEIMLKLARQYTFSIIQERSVDECFEEEKVKLANANATKKFPFSSDQDILSKLN